MKEELVGGRFGLCVSFMWDRSTGMVAAVLSVSHVVTDGTLMAIYRRP